VLVLPALLFCGSCRLERENDSKIITIEVAIFEGGYGLDWFREIARRYEKLHPNVRIHLWGDPRVDEKIRPRILRHDPPDVANSMLPTWKLIVAGKLYPLDEALDSPAYGQKITWRQSIFPGLLTNYQYQGKTYAMPTNFGAWVCWYDRRLFRQHGWKPPKTWGEFTKLCEKIKASGIAPLAFQGKYPIYAWSTLLSLYQRLVPFEKWYAMQDLKPGAFLDPDFIRAAALVQEMAQKYFQPGAMAMTHTESQMEFVNRRTAMVFCGLWLHNEMKNAIPNDFEMDCFAVPMVEGGKGDHRAVLGGGGEHFFVFADARHPKTGTDFLKFMVSKESGRTYIETLNSLPPVRGSAEGAKVAPELRTALQIMEGSSRICSDRLTSLYLELGKKILPAELAELMRGSTTPQEFARRLEAAAEAIRRNPDIYKPPAMGVPPL
ncbi:MAG TPA: extracellular solute-binding protein, partial [Chthonomonadales bacterium]|nr:extracellular solute-binding protein [Chthonomonadales bacterium]